VVQVHIPEFFCFSSIWGPLPSAAWCGPHQPHTPRYATTVGYNLLYQRISRRGSLASGKLEDRAEIFTVGGGSDLLVRKKHAALFTKFTWPSGVEALILSNLHILNLAPLPFGVFFPN